MSEPEPLPFESLPTYPEGIGPGSVLSRLVAGLGFRLRWATEGLAAEEYTFRADPEGFSIAEVQEHIGQMVSWVHAQFCAHRPGIAPLPELPPDHDPFARRGHCLRSLAHLEELLRTLDSGSLADVVVDHPRRGRRPFWVLVNGPLSDALTHVGQISAWRRLAGNPAPRSDPFDGRPPGESPT